MKKGLLCILGMIVIGFSYGQNNFPTAAGSSAVLDGGNYIIKSPNTGSWARGNFFRRSNSSTNLAGIGLLGSNNSPTRLFLGVGATPWTSTNGITILANGRVGVGILNPSQKLTVNGTTQSNSFIINQGNIFLNTPNVPGWGRGLHFRRNASTITGGAGIFGNNNSQKRIYLAHGATPWNSTKGIQILTNGRVGIGTLNPGAYQLAVNGKVRAKEVVVETGWSDFVFESDYNLRSLDEVADYIEENGHLPEIPSATEVAEKGVKLGEMDSKLLMKIEELTLYLIAQDKEIKALKERLKR